MLLGTTTSALNRLSLCRFSKNNPFRNCVVRLIWRHKMSFLPGIVRRSVLACAFPVRTWSTALLRMFTNTYG